MIITIDIASPRPLYRQIADGIRGAVADGELEPGERLPAGRELAAALGVNLETVQRAYRLLASEGLVVSRVGRGSMVAVDVDRSRLQLVGPVDHLIGVAMKAGLGPDEVSEIIRRRWEAALAG